MGTVGVTRLSLAFKCFALLAILSATANACDLHENCNNCLVRNPLTKECTASVIDETCALRQRRCVQCAETKAANLGMPKGCVECEAVGGHLACIDACGGVGHANYLAASISTCGMN
jgi:hypothetical protein